MFDPVCGYVETENRSCIAACGNPTNRKVLAESDLDRCPRRYTKNEIHHRSEAAKLLQISYPAHLRSRILNRLEDHSRCQPLERICSPVDVWKKPGFGWKSHLGLSLFRNLRSTLRLRGGQNLRNCSQRLTRAIILPIAMILESWVRKVVKATPFALKISFRQLCAFC